MVAREVRAVMQLQPETRPPLAEARRSLEYDLLNKCVADLNARDSVAAPKLEARDVPVRPQCATNNQRPERINKHPRGVPPRRQRNQQQEQPQSQQATELPQH